MTHRERGKRMLNRSIRIAALALGLCGWATAVASQDCPASVPQLPPGWVLLPPPSGKVGPLTRVLALKCSDCAPELRASFTTGLGSAADRAGPRGAAWAEEGAGTPHVRNRMLAGMIADLRKHLPQCAAAGEIEGVTTVAAGSFITVATSNTCPPPAVDLGELTFAGFDGKCLHGVSVMWKGSPTLAPEARSRVHALLAAARFGN